MLFFVIMLKNKRKYIRTKPYKTKEAKCEICNDTNMENFYPGQKKFCKKCQSIKYHNNPNKQEILDRSKEWNRDNIIRSRVHGAKNRAKRKGLFFELTDEIIMQKLIEQDYKCAITGVPLSMNMHEYNSLSLDRKIKELGYSNENTIIVTKFINWSKNNLELSKFIEVLKEACVNL